MRHRPIAIALAVSALCSALIGVSPASAEVGIGVTPAILDLAGPVGGAGSVEVLVENEGSAPFDVVSSVFGLDAATGLPSAVAWSDVTPARLSLDPGTSGSFTFTIDIPADADLGGHYAALSIATASPDVDGAPPTGFAGRIVVPVLIAVSGDERHPTPEAIPVLERAALFLETDGGLLARAQVRNDGGVHIPLAGSVALALPGQLPSASIDVPIGRVLPERSRSFPAASSLEAKPDTAYEVTFDLGKPAVGRVLPQPDISTSFEVVTTPRLRISEPVACSGADGSLVVGATLVNEGSLGIAPATAFWIEVPGVGRAAAAQSTPPPLVWPDSRLDLVAAITSPVAPGDYTLVAEAAYGLDSVARAEAPLTIGEDQPGAEGSCDATGAAPAA